MCGVRPVSPVSDLTSGRPPVERLPPKAPDGRSAPPDTEPLRTEVGKLAPDDVRQEVQALAELLAEVVQLTAHSAIFPGCWTGIAELAMEHASVRRALHALGVEQVTAGIENLRELIPGRVSDDV